MAEQCIYSKAELPASPMTLDTRDFHFQCAISYLKTKQGGYLVFLKVTVCHRFKIHEEKIHK